MNKDSIFQKYEKLKHVIRPFGRVAVAFSGGVDSSLLLYSAIETLGPSNVLALHGRSCLNLAESAIEDFHNANFKQHTGLVLIDLDPLSWPDFVENGDKRCYYCKKKTYSSFKDYLTDKGEWELCDGTNLDDLGQVRPGLAVLDEMHITTPLVEAGLGKKDVRFLAHSLGLSNHNTPSNSCLATRLIYRHPVESVGLQTVEELEKVVKNMGFEGCRVKPVDTYVVIELRQQDFIKMSQRHNRIAIENKCREYGYKSIYLDLKGRL